MIILFLARIFFLRCSHNGSTTLIRLWLKTNLTEGKLHLTALNSVIVIDIEVLLEERIKVKSFCARHKGTCGSRSTAEIQQNYSRNKAEIQQKYSRNTAALILNLHSRNTAALILNLHSKWKWAVRFPLWPLHLVEQCPRYTFGRKVGRPQRRPGAFAEEENLLHLSGIFHGCSVGSPKLYWPC